MKLTIEIKVYAGNHYHSDADREITMIATPAFLKTATKLLSDEITGAVEDCIDEIGQEEMKDGE